MSNFNHNFNGSQSLQYLGSRAASPPNFVKIGRDPTTQDYKEFVIGDLWLNTASNALWFLASLSGANATWVQLSGGAAALDSLTGDTGAAVPPNISDNIFLLGGTGIQVNGNPGTNTLTFEAIDPLTTQYDADSGSAVANSGVINLVGGGALSTSATGSTVTLTDGGILASQYTADSGTAAPSANNLNVIGGGALSTSGSGDTLTITDSGRLADSFITNSGTAIPSSNNLNVLGTASNFLTTSASGDTVNVNISKFTDATVNNWTPVIIGSGTAGTGTYTRQHGVYMRLGKLVFTTFDLVWTAHTGSGDLEIDGFPVNFSLASSEYPGAVFYENITLPAGAIQISLNGTNATSIAELTALIDGGSRQQVPLDTAGTLSGTLIYFSDEP